jgi:hypothetical protein
MDRIRIAAVGIAMALSLILAGSLEAQPRRVFVSATGRDTNPCSRTRPCRSLDEGVATVAANGEVIVLDSGNYGDVAINKAVVIAAAPGVYATVVQEGSEPGISVNAPGGALVVLRNLTIHRQSTAFGGEGLRVNSGGQVYIEDCVIEGAFADGVTLGSSGTAVYLTDTRIRGGIDENALDIFGGEVHLTRVQVDGTALDAMEIAGASTQVTIRDSVISNTSTGIIMSNATVTIENSQFIGHGTALNVSSGELRLSQSVIANNGTGLAGAGTKISFGNNRFEGNGADGAFTSTTALK